MNLRVWLIGTVGAAMLVACGPATSIDDSGDLGTSGDATDDSGGESTADASTAADSTGNAVCEALFDEEVGAASTVILRNDTTTPLFVGVETPCQATPFHILGPDDGPLQWMRGDCAISCRSVLADECFDCGPCDGPKIIRIEPGATYEQTWLGNFFADQSIPSECDGSPCQPQCEQRTLAPDGDYMLRAEVRSDCLAISPKQCECPEGESSCVVTSNQGLAPVTAEVDGVLSHPGGTVELVFQ
ncbi:MAG: hypothetical protein K0V04_45455 [Deltaproteobacteria bacterium]|nr:hypothetical protein [Deltaproteobacteria bacterium]